MLHSSVTGLIPVQWCRHRQAQACGCERQCGYCIIGQVGWSGVQARASEPSGHYKVTRSEHRPRGVVTMVAGTSVALAVRMGGRALYGAALRPVCLSIHSGICTDITLWPEHY